MKPMHIRSCILIAASSAILAACAGDSSKYPSLAIRDAERVSGEFSTVAPADAAPAAPVASDQEIGSIAARARATHQLFLGEQSGALGLVREARGGGIESNERARAETALSVLTSLRSDTQLAMAELDTLEARVASTFAPTDAIAVAQIQVASFLSEQDEILDALLAELGQ
ncbi:hypothetical protein [uncultured Erythrobacter sp.]|uniref:hypothetical protein n=1 Tax=uncultured Erythrobacter sp. TaxID=263913 RepID=UPI002626C075|nr:hypothetical protein [uncultured Erythrobacter sp.]